MIAAFLTRHPMPKSTAARTTSKVLAFAALAVLLALSIGGALGERMEQRAAQDRFSFGDVAENCDICSSDASLN